jgi:hypothetical protein
MSNKGLVLAGEAGTPQQAYFYVQQGILDGMAAKEPPTNPSMSSEDRGASTGPLDRVTKKQMRNKAVNIHFFVSLDATTHPSLLSPLNLNPHSQFPSLFTGTATIQSQAQG